MSPELSIFGIVKYPLLLIQWIENNLFLTFIILIVGMSIYHFWEISIPLVLYEWVKSIIF